MTVAERNGCHLCIAMHTARLAALARGPGRGRCPAVGHAPLRTRGSTRSARSPLRVLDTAGDVGDPALEEFLSHGYTRRNALEVVFGIGAYTLSTLANRLTGAPVDDELSAFA